MNAVASLVEPTRRVVMPFVDMSDDGVDVPPVIIESNWIAQEGSQRLFLSCPVPEIFNAGTRGSGKTDGLLMKFAKHTNRGFGENWRGIIFRETYKQLADIIAKSKRRFYAAYGTDAKYNKSDYSWTFPDGAQLLLRHMERPEDYWNYHGHEYPFIGWEELTNWLTLECYELMKSCSRSSYPGMPRIIASTGNPFGKGHAAVKAYFIDPAPRGQIIVDKLSPQGRVAIHGNLLENKVLMAADPNYITNLDAISDENRRKAWRFGSWDINVGSMFDDVWNSDIHWIEPFEIPQSWSIDRSFDWGSSKPFSVGWWAKSDGSPAKLADGKWRHYPRGTMFRIAEWYGCRKNQPNVGVKMLSSQIAVGIIHRQVTMKIHNRVLPGPADASIFDDQDGKSIADEMALNGVRWIPAHKGPGSRKQGWERMREMMQASVDNDVDGLYIFNTCKDFKRTVPSLPRDDVDLDDVDTEAEDHIGDESRYELLRKPRVVTQDDMGA